MSDNNVIYDYREVVGWSDHIEGGLFNLEQLFVPINITNTHWIFIRVHFESKTIEIYNSFGSPDHQYQKYLWVMRSYLYDKEFKDVVPEARPNFDDWKRTWKTQDKSRDSPRQENMYDCRLFTMISIYLMSRGVQLQRSSYDQFGVSSRQLRQTIAFVLVQANEPSPTVSVAPHITSRQRVTAAQAYFKRKQRRESWMVPGGKKAGTDAGPTLRFLCTTHKPLVNRKRRAKSLTDRHHTQLTLYQSLGRHSKKAQKRGKEIICKL